MRDEIVHTEVLDGGELLVEGSTPLSGERARTSVLQGGGVAFVVAVKLKRSSKSQIKIGEVGNVSLNTSVMVSVMFGGGASRARLAVCDSAFQSSDPGETINDSALFSRLPSSTRGRAQRRSGSGGKDS